MTPEQTELIQKHIKACQLDGLSQEKTSLRLSPFIRSLAQATRDESIVPIANSSEYLKSLARQYWSAEPPGR